MTEALSAHADAAVAEGFLVALPRITAHARVVFRFERCASRREECVAEVRAIAWRWYFRLRQRGKEPDAFVGALATFACRQVRCGRRLCGQEASKDALSPLAQSRHRFACDEVGDGALEALRDDARTPVPAQAAFRLDFPRWLASLGERHRRVAEDLMSGEIAQDVAVKHGITAGRISQIRAELRRSWHRFHGEPHGMHPSPLLTRS